MSRFIFTLLLATLSLQGWCQLDADDAQLIANVDRHDASFDPRQPKWMKIGGNVITRYNPVSLVLSSSLYFYQKVISPQLQSKCPYEVSCSAFGMLSIEEMGVIRGIPLTADRLTRCTQFSKIDIMQSQIDDRTGFIKDDLSKYKKPHHH